MSTTRRRRISAHNEQLRAQEMHRGRDAATSVERIQRFDDSVTRLVAWTAIAMVMLIAVVALVAV